MISGMVFVLIDAAMIFFQAVVAVDRLHVDEIPGFSFWNSTVAFLKKVSAAGAVSLCRNRTTSARAPAETYDCIAGRRR